GHTGCDRLTTLGPRVTALRSAALPAGVIVDRRSTELADRKGGAPGPERKQLALEERHTTAPGEGAVPGPGPGPRYGPPALPDNLARLTGAVQPARLVGPNPPREHLTFPHWGRKRQPLELRQHLYHALFAGQRAAGPALPRQQEALILSECRRPRLA